MQIEPTMRALSDPTRLRIMRLLCSIELAVGELAQALGQSQPRVSRHIAILCDAGLAERRHEGSWVFLRAAIGNQRGNALGEAVARILAIAEEEDAEFAAICDKDREELAVIRAARDASAEQYFAAHVDEWDELRKLHSPDRLVEDALAQALGNAPLGQLLDIGTGTGRMAELFCEQADHVVALDKSLDMLRAARAKLQQFPAERIELVLGDFSALPFQAARFDTILLHQVLHFAQDPALALSEAARVSKRGSRIAIVDFAAHNHEELRGGHAHERLGFGDETMANLLREAGFSPEPPLSLDGGELTVKIWLGARIGAPVEISNSAETNTPTLQAPASKKSTSIAPISKNPNSNSKSNSNSNSNSNSSSQKSNSQKSNSQKSDSATAKTSSPKSATGAAK